MAAGNTYSTFVSNFYAAPKVVNDKVHGGNARVVSVTAVYATTDIDDANDRKYLITVPWTASVKSIVLFNDDLDSHSTPTLAADIGIAKLVQDGNGSVTITNTDNDSYASAITTLQAANTTGVQVGFEARDINKINNKVWQDAGLSAAPTDGSVACIYTTITTAAATGAAGDVTLVVTYTE